MSAHCALLTLLKTSLVLIFFESDFSKNINYKSAKINSIHGFGHECNHYFLSCEKAKNLLENTVSSKSI